MQSFLQIISDKIYHLSEWAGVRPPVGLGVGSLLGDGAQRETVGGAQESGPAKT